MYVCLSFQTVGQRVIMECVNCEINLQKRQGKINDYSKASVEVLHHMSELSADVFPLHAMQPVDPSVES